MSESLNYAVGQECTWHGPLHRTLNVTKVDDDEEQYRCPSCGAVVKAMSAEAFWGAALVQELGVPGSLQTTRWSEGKCFPDLETLVNAYRQAMEGEQ